ncbi:hypothetical protein BA177_02915 [Woeseia oceani]|uniref:Uncharacterized protein n=1 Tax=Woeseia oceani TaxID=1548547 RepID=A0A193LCZ6_9GAMM|nr:hypothetical protein BA177_02915 [Woeseia oceani]
MVGTGRSEPGQLRQLCGIGTGALPGPRCIASKRTRGLIQCRNSCGVHADQRFFGSNLWLKSLFPVYSATMMKNALNPENRRNRQAIA